MLTHGPHAPFKGHSPHKPQLVSCRLDSQCPVMIILNILTGQTETQYTIPTFSYIN